MARLTRLHLRRPISRPRLFQFNAVFTPYIRLVKNPRYMDGVAQALARFPIARNRAIDKKSRQFKRLE